MTNWESKKKEVNHMTRWAASHMKKKIKCMSNNGSTGKGVQMFCYIRK